MAIINGATKKGQALLNLAKCNKGTELRQIYGRWSDLKENAMQACKRERVADGGWNFHIVSSNRWRFSVAWEYMNPETGEVMTKIKTDRTTYIVDGTRKSEEV